MAERIKQFLAVLAVGFAVFYTGYALIVAAGEHVTLMLGSLP